MIINNYIRNMNRIDGIIVTVTGYTYKPGINTLSKSMSKEDYKDFQIYMADKLATNLYDAINKQRFSKKWPKLSFTYYLWKKRHNLSLHIWEATGCLKSNIKVFKKGNLIAVGFRQKDVYPDTSLKVNTVARYVEYGTNRSSKGGGMPPRPLFRPVLVYMRKHVNDYYRNYMKDLKRLGKKHIYI